MNIKKYKNSYIANFKDMKDYSDNETCFVLDAESNGNILWHGKDYECMYFIDNILETMPKSASDLPNFSNLLCEEIENYCKDFNRFCKELQAMKDNLELLKTHLSEDAMKQNDISKKIFYTALRYEDFLKNWKNHSKRRLNNKESVETSVSIDIYNKKGYCIPSELHISTGKDYETFSVSLYDFYFLEIPDNRLVDFLNKNYNNIDVFTFEKEGKNQEFKIERLDLSIIKNGLKMRSVEMDILKGNTINNILDKTNDRTGFPKTPRKVYIENFKRSVNDKIYTISDVEEFMKKEYFSTIKDMGEIVIYKNWKECINEAILEMKGEIPEEDLSESKKENIFVQFFKKFKIC